MLLIPHSLVQSHRRYTVLVRLVLPALDLVSATYKPNQFLSHPMFQVFRTHCQEMELKDNLPEICLCEVPERLAYKICLHQRHIFCCVSEVKHSKYISEGLEKEISGKESKATTPRVIIHEMIHQKRRISLAVSCTSTNG